MRVKNRHILYAWSFLTANLISAQTLKDFIDEDDFSQVDFILASEPIFDVNEADLQTDFNDKEQNFIEVNIPRVHINPLSIDVNVVASPVFTEGDIIIPSLDDGVLENDTVTDKNEHIIVETHTDGEVNAILSNQPSFTENEDVPLRKAENVPLLSTTTEVVHTEVENKLFLDEVEEETIEIVEYHEVAFEEINETEFEEVNEEQQTEWDQMVHDLGNSWYLVDWFGHFFSTQNPASFSDGGWIYHINLGWLFISSNSFDSVWIWSDNFQHWIWTSETAFPYANVHSDAQSWLYFDLDRNLVFDFDTQKYFDIN